MPIPVRNRNDKNDKSVLDESDELTQAISKLKESIDALDKAIK